MDVPYIVDCYQLGLQHYNNGNWYLALQYFQKSLKINPFNYLALSFTANCEWKLSLYKDLKKTIDKIYEIYPDYQVKPDLIQDLKRHQIREAGLNYRRYNGALSDPTIDEEEYSFYDLQNPDFLEEWEEQEKYS